MAALPDRPQTSAQTRVVDLRSITAEQMERLSAAQVAAWKSELDWDYQPSADLVRRFIQIKALNGYALLASSPRGTELAGYCYYVCEDGKGLIGDLFVVAEHRTAANENSLLESALSAMLHISGVRRVEAQLMMLGNPLDRTIPHPSWFHSYPRLFLEAPAQTNLPERSLTGITITHWHDFMQDTTARLIADSYEGHIDSQINDQYRTAAGARRFLTNIVQYPGCGSFFAPASFAAMDRAGRLTGVSLASLVATDVGHITQVCVAPSHRSIGLGYELMRRSIVAIAAQGCRAVSLTVTASNESAARLYRDMGFVNRRTFAAYVWQRGNF